MKSLIGIRGEERRLRAQFVAHRANAGQTTESHKVLQLLVEHTDDTRSVSVCGALSSHFWDFDQIWVIIANIINLFWLLMLFIRILIVDGLGHREVFQLGNGIYLLL